MAEDLQINRCWYHGGDKPHYDIPKRRIDEIASKCIRVSSRQILEIIKLSHDQDFIDSINLKLFNDGTKSDSQ
jgi:hypothetical protein